MTTSGRERLFQEMADVHGGALRRWARAHAPRGDVADLIQDAFERALRKRPPVADHDELRAWLFVVLRNLMIDRVRAADARTVFGLELDGIAAAAPDDPPPWRSVDWSDVREALPRLDPRLRQVFTMFSQGMSLLQIAAATGTPVATVGTRLFRARKRLRLLVLEHLDEAPRRATRASNAIALPSSASRTNGRRKPFDVADVQHFPAPHARAAGHQHAVL
jgi:RNA polymerase sigma-70 factor (ECF subfamily)